MARWRQARRSLLSAPAQSGLLLSDRAQFYSPAEIIMIDLDDRRLQEGESEWPLSR